MPMEAPPENVIEWQSGGVGEGRKRELVRVWFSEDG